MEAELRLIVNNQEWDPQAILAIRSAFKLVNFFRPPVLVYQKLYLTESLAVSPALWVPSRYHFMRIMLAGSDYSAFQCLRWRKLWCSCWGCECKGKVFPIPVSHSLGPASPRRHSYAYQRNWNEKKITTSSSLAFINSACIIRLLGCQNRFLAQWYLALREIIYWAH